MLADDGGFRSSLGRRSPLAHVSNSSCSGVSGQRGAERRAEGQCDAYTTLLHENVADQKEQGVALVLRTSHR